MTGLLHAGAWPSYSEMQVLPGYKHGQQISDQILGDSREKIFAGLRMLPRLKSPYFCWEFECINGRDPAPGDILRASELQAHYSETQIKSWRPIWERNIRQYPFPFQVKDGLLLIKCASHVRPPECDQDGYEPAWWGVPRYRWADIEGEAMGRLLGNAVTEAWQEGRDPREVLLRCKAVVFKTDGGTGATPDEEMSPR
jgi:hypothetical protein